jgi:hypothetical protein
MSNEQDRNPIGAGSSVIMETMEKLKPAIMSAGFNFSIASIRLPETLVIRSSYMGKYLFAQSDGYLEWSQEWNEKDKFFKLEILREGKIAFKSCYGKYISVKNDTTIACDQQELHENAAWTLEWIGNGIALKSSNGKYLRPMKDGTVRTKYDIAEEKEILTFLDPNFQRYLT